MYKIIIVEDEENIRLELKLILENSSYNVEAVENFTDVYNQIINSDADLVLLDVNLPNKSGLQICSQIRKKSDIPIIFLTSLNTSMDELNCITMGGDDYISKPYNVPILLARIKSLLKRSKKEETKPQNSITYKDVTLDMLGAVIRHNGKEIELSKNELKILYYLFINKEKVVSRIDIIEYLWDNQLFVDDNTLSVNITRIRNKLKVIGVEDFIETKRGLGYKI